MVDDEVPGELRGPFAIPDFWPEPSADPYALAESSNLLFASLKPFGKVHVMWWRCLEKLLRCALGLSEHFNSLSESTNSKELHLPDLSSFEFGLLEDVDTPDDTEESLLETEHDTSSLADETDIWRFSGNELSAKQIVPYHSWDAFFDFEPREPASAYTTEAGPQVFDAIVQFQTEEQGAVKSGAQKVGHLNAYITVGSCPSTLPKGIAESRN